MLHVYAIIVHNVKKESNTSVLMATLHSKLFLLILFSTIPFSLYGTVGIRSEDLQYLRSMSYLFLCKLRTYGYMRKHAPPDNRVVRHCRLHYECAFIRYKSISKLSSQSAQEIFLRIPPLALSR